jgi:hypothetical protein
VSKKIYKPAPLLDINDFQVAKKKKKVKRGRSNGDTYNQNGGGVEGFIPPA